MDRNTLTDGYLHLRMEAPRQQIRRQCAFLVVMACWLAEASSFGLLDSMALTSPAQSTSNSASPSVNVNAPVFVPKASIPPVSSPDPFKPAYLRDPSVFP